MVQYLLQGGAMGRRPFDEGAAAMLSIDQIIDYMEREIARWRLEGKREELRHLQYAAGTLMHAAESVGDKDSARRFRLVAAQAANMQEELAG
jgi:hypothetical protein